MFLQLGRDVEAAAAAAPPVATPPACLTGLPISLERLAAALPLPTILQTLKNLLQWCNKCGSAAVDAPLSAEAKIEALLPSRELAHFGRALTGTIFERVRAPLPVLFWGLFFCVLHDGIMQNGAIAMISLIGIPGVSKADARQGFASYLNDICYSVQFREQDKAEIERKLNLRHWPLMTVALGLLLYLSFCHS